MKKKIIKMSLLILYIFVLILLIDNNTCSAKTAGTIPGMLTSTKTTLVVDETATITLNEKIESLGYNVDGVTKWEISNSNLATLSTTPINQTSTGVQGGYTKTAKIIPNKNNKNGGTVTVKVYYYTIMSYGNTKVNYTSSIDIIILSKVESAQKDVDNADEQLKKLENAYLTIPNGDASYAEISTFIKSDSKFNNLNNFNTVKLETLKKWKQTYDSLNGNWYKQDGNYEIIIDRINNLEGQTDSYNSDSHKDKINEEYDYSKNAAQEKLDEAKKKLLQIQTDLGAGRTNVIFKDVLTNIDDYIPTDEASDGRLESKVSVILTVITNIGMVLAILMVAIIGVKYMLGSLEEKAEYKKDMIPYLVGACLLFGITVIVKVLQQIGQSINNI